jgi:hypothetical protein
MKADTTTGPVERLEPAEPLNFVAQRQGQSYTPTFKATRVDDRMMVNHSARRRLVAISGALDCAMLTWCPSTFASTGRLDLSQYAHTVWRVAYGFADGPVESVAKTRDGSSDRDRFPFASVRPRTHDTMVFRTPSPISRRAMGRAAASQPVHAIASRSCQS